MIRTITQFLNHEGKEQLISGEPHKVDAYIKMNARQVIRTLTMDDDDILYRTEYVPKSPEDYLMHILDMNILDTKYPS